MLPQKILKSRCWEMQFPTFWTSTRVVFMKIFLAIWRLFSVKNRVSFPTLRVRSVRTGKCCETEHTVFRPYPRSLACLTICRYETKAAHSSQLFKSVRPAGTQPSHLVSSFGERCLFNSGVWRLPVTGGLLPSIGPNK